MAMATGQQLPAASWSSWVKCLGVLQPRSQRHNAADGQKGAPAAHSDKAAGQQAVVGGAK